MKRLPPSQAPSVWITHHSSCDQSATTIATSVYRTADTRHHGFSSGSALQPARMGKDHSFTHSLTGLLVVLCLYASGSLPKPCTAEV